jgi:hypothetical protein
MKMISGARALDKVYKRRDRYEIPDWQRQEVWGRSKKQSLIDSILMNWKLPKFYFVKTNDQPEEYEVVDGQQRLTSIFEFFDNELPLSPASEEKFGAKYYKDLPDALSDEFDDFEIEFDLIEDATDEEIKEFFQRLQEGLPLTSSEKLNSIHSNLRDFCSDLSGHSFFSNKISVSDKRYGHFDITAKASCIEIDGIDVGLRFDDMQAVFNSQSNFSKESEVAKRLKSAIGFLDAAIPERLSSLRNRSVVQSIITLATRLVATDRHKGLEGLFGEFINKFLQELSSQVELGKNATDHDYLDFQKTVSSNLRIGPKTRNQILLRKLLSFKPDFYSAFDASDIAESGLLAQVKNEASNIAEIITKVNQAHSAQSGEDLFKPTTKTIEALSIISEEINDFEGYGRFIESCYYIFHEGVGNRLGDDKPDSFQDINLLRTHLQHDVDHGRDSKVRSKRRKIGRTFKKYSGQESPETLTNEYFPIVHNNILNALRGDLEQILGIYAS